jgi:DNA-directed RNA polymerase II subunit RPB7
MFQELKLNHTVRIAPSSLSFGINDTIDQELRVQVEGSVTARNGMVIRVTNIDKIGVGRVSQRSGYGLFDVTYSAIVCCPCSGMVIDAIITRVSAQGFHADAGPLEVFVAKPNLLPTRYSYRPEADSWMSNERDPPLRASTVVRVKIINTLPNAERTRLTGTGSMDGIGLGPLGTRRF